MEKPSNPVSEKDKAEAKRLYDSLGRTSLKSLSNIAQALADARSEGYVAGVEDAARVVRGKEVHTLGIFQYHGELFADAIMTALLGPKKEGGG